MPTSARGLLAAAAVVLAGCGGSDGAATTPEERAVTIATTACGHASATAGSGVVVADERVLTAAHVVAGAGDVRVTRGAHTVAGEIVVLDRGRDLAVLRVPGLAASPVATTQLATGERADVLGGSSGPTEATVTRRLQMTVDDVRGLDRSRRAGYELDVRIEGGDSGAGLFAGDRLAGIVFAVPVERAATFAVRAEEVEAVLDDGSERPHACDPAASLVIAGAGG